MNTPSIPLTKNETATIAQRALLERIAGRPGIWVHLHERIQPGKKVRRDALKLYK